MAQERKDMQDRTPHGVFCQKCGAEIVPASRINSYRQRTVDEMVEGHRCDTTS